MDASLTLENDFFAGYDRHYTNGVQIAVLAERRELPDAVNALPFVSWSDDDRIVLAIGQRVYTPDDIDARDPDPQDRPYAGWIYAMADARRRAASAIDHLTVTAGLVGPGAFARHAQNVVHDVLGKDPARGWHAQLKSEPTLMVGFERAWPSAWAGRWGSVSVDLSPRVGAVVGTPLTHAHGGLVARVGRRLPDDLPATHVSLGPPRDGYRGTAAFGWYLWAGLDARLVAHNVFIEGNTFRDSAGVDLEARGHDLQVGIVAAWPEGRVGFTYVERSREFEGQGSPDRFGQLAVSFRY